MRLLSIVLLFFLNWNCFSQLNILPTGRNIPVDPELRTGRLNNGFSYYIRTSKNLRESGVQIRFIVRAGDDNSTIYELAHLIEHLAYEGSLRFPGDSAVRYLGTKNMIYGSDVNAYTAGTHTAYKFNIPKDSLRLIESVLWIIRDFSNNLSFEGDRIAAQKGAVVEEVRMKLETTIAKSRAAKNSLVFGVENYGESYLLDVERSMNSLSRDAIVEFYEKWYRPDLEAVIIVGDVDVVSVESLVQRVFSDMRKPIGRIEQEGFKGRKNLDNQDRRVILLNGFSGHDLEVEIYCKRRKVSVELAKCRDYRRLVMVELMNNLVMDRFNNLNQRSERTDINGWIGFDYVDSGIDALIFKSDGVNPDNLEYTLKKIITEIRRMDRLGFSDEEFSRVKDLYKQSINNDGSRYWFMERYTKNFVSRRAMPSPFIESFFKRKYVDEIRLKEINREISKWIDVGRNIDVTISGSFDSLLDRLGTKTVERWVKQACDSNDPKEDNVADFYSIDSLLSGVTMPDSLGAIWETAICQGDSSMKILRLCNGVTVILSSDTANYSKKNPDSIQILGRSPGGISVYHGIEKVMAESAAFVISQSGVGNISASDLKRFLLDRNISFNPYIGDEFDQIGGTVSKRYLENLFQLIYLFFNFPRQDTLVFNEWKRSRVSDLDKIDDDPVSFFNDFVYHFVNNMNFISRNDILELKLKDFLDIYSERFSGASDFIFLISGDFRGDKNLEVLIRRYLGNIKPGIKDTNHPFFNSFNEEPIDTVIYRGSLDVADVRLFFLASKNISYSAQNIFDLGVLCKILERVIRDRIRAKEGGAYSPVVNLNFFREADEQMSFRICVQFTCKRGEQKYLINCIKDEISSISSKITDKERLALALLEARSAQVFNLDNFDKNMSVCLDNGYAHESLSLDRVSPDRLNAISNSIFVDGKCQVLILLPEDL